MKRLVIFLLMLALPFTVAAKEKKHIKTSPDQECAECHGDVTRIWQEGKHGLMLVECVVCHGSTDKTFVAKPDTQKCAGCHGEEVKDVEKRLPPKARSCYLCHDYHSVGLSFHSKSKGGN